MTRPDKCPACASTEPHLHPAVQEGGEVQPCIHPFHLIVTAQNTPERVEAHRRLVAAMGMARDVGAVIADVSPAEAVLNDPPPLFSDESRRRYKRRTVLVDVDEHFFRRCIKCNTEAMAKPRNLIFDNDTKAFRVELAEFPPGWSHLVFRTDGDAFTLGMTYYLPICPECSKATRGFLGIDLERIASGDLV